MLLSLSDRGCRAVTASAMKWERWVSWWAKCTDIATERNCEESEKSCYSSSPMLLLPDAFERFLIGSAAMNWGCSPLWAYSCGRNVSPLLELLSGWRYGEFALLEGAFFSVILTLSCLETLHRCKLWTKSCPYWNPSEMGCWCGVRVSQRMAFRSLWHNCLNCLKKEKAAAAQSVTTCPFYWQWMLTWSLGVFALTTQ